MDKTNVELYEQAFAAIRQTKDLFLKDNSILLGDLNDDRSQLEKYEAVLHKFQVILQTIGDSSGQTIESMQSFLQQYGGTDWSKDKDARRQYLSILKETELSLVLERGSVCRIVRNDPTPGMASIIITNLALIVKCLEEGYVPVIDTIHADNFLGEISEKYQCNAWEIFFEQPFPEFRLENAVKVVDGIPDFMPRYEMDILTNEAVMSFWRAVAKKYLHLSHSMQNRLENIIEQLQWNQEDRVVGVLARGTDYVSKRPFNHPVQPDAAELIEKTKAEMTQYHCDFVYLATESEEIKNVFLQEFGEKLILTQQIYYDDNTAEYLNQINKKEHVDVVEKTEEYLIALYLLARCNCLIGGRTSGIVVSYLLADHLEDFFVWNKGKYGIDHEEMVEGHIF